MTRMPLMSALMLSLGVLPPLPEPRGDAPDRESDPLDDLRRAVKRIAEVAEPPDGTPCAWPGEPDPWAVLEVLR